MLLQKNAIPSEGRAGQHGLVRNDRNGLAVFYHFNTLQRTQCKNLDWIVLRPKRLLDVPGGFRTPKKRCKNNVKN